MPHENCSQCGRELPNEYIESDDLPFCNEKCEDEFVFNNEVDDDFYDDNDDVGEPYPDYDDGRYDD